METEYSTITGISWEIKNDETQRMISRNLNKIGNLTFVHPNLTKFAGPTVFS